MQTSWTWELLASDYFADLPDNARNPVAAWMEGLHKDVGWGVLRNGSTAPPDYLEASIHAFNISGLPISHATAAKVGRLGGLAARALNRPQH